MKPEEWNKILNGLLQKDDFINSIKNQGFYISPEKYRTFRDYAKEEWGITSTVNTAVLLSIDFWSRQPKILTQNGYYLIRTGEGSFAILKEEEFERPYLSLKMENTMEIKPEISSGFENLARAFDENVLENSALEQLRFNKVFDKVIQEVTGKEQEYYVGPRGNTTRKFDIYLRNKGGNLIKIKTYSGQAELDYTLWTRDSVLLFEAKKTEIENVLDLGWHKLAYPAFRFLNYGDLKIYPVHFLRLKNKVMLFVFPRFKFYENGIILNDKDQMTPQKIFSVNL